MRNSRVRAAHDKPLRGPRRSVTLGALDRDTVIVDRPGVRHVAGPVPDHAIHIPPAAELRALRRLQAGTGWRSVSGHRDSLCLVFVDETGVPLRPVAYYDEFRRLAQAARLPRIRLHDLRHTAGTLLASSCIPLTTCARLGLRAAAIWWPGAGSNRRPSDLQGAESRFGSCLVVFVQVREMIGSALASPRLRRAEHQSQGRALTAASSSAAADPTLRPDCSASRKRAVISARRRTRGTRATTSGVLPTEAVRV